MNRLYVLLILSVFLCHKMIAQTTMCINYKDGRRDGLSERWYSNGKMFKRINYKDHRGMAMGEQRKRLL